MINGIWRTYINDRCNKMGPETHFKLVRNSVRTVPIFQEVTFSRITHIEGRPWSLSKSRGLFIRVKRVDTRGFTIGAGSLKNCLEYDASLMGREGVYLRIIRK